MWFDDVRDYLIANGITGGGSPPVWPVYIGYLPDDQDRVISIYPSGGYPADTLQRENRTPLMQTRIRAGREEFQIGYSKSIDVFNLLQDASQGNGSPILLPKFVYIQARNTEPLSFNDNHLRPNFTFNWNVMLTGF